MRSGRTNPPKVRTNLAAKSVSADVIIYGGTSAGIAAAVQVSRMGHSVILIEPGHHIGGLTTGGLGFTDSGDKQVIGGIAREFYRRIHKHYEPPDAWVYEKATANGRYRANEDAMWTFEPKVAEALFHEMIKEAKVTLVMERTSGIARPELNFKDRVLNPSRWNLAGLIAVRSSLMGPMKAT